MVSGGNDGGCFVFCYNKWLLNDGQISVERFYKRTEGEDVKRTRDEGGKEEREKKGRRECALLTREYTSVT